MGTLYVHPTGAEVYRLMLYSNVLHILLFMQKRGVFFLCFFFVGGGDSLSPRTLPPPSGYDPGVLPFI